MLEILTTVKVIPRIKICQRLKKERKKKKKTESRYLFFFFKQILIGVIFKKKINICQRFTVIIISIGFFIKS